MKVAVTPPAFCKSEGLKSKLSSLFPGTVYNEKNDYLSESELIDFLKDADAAIIGRDPVTKATLEALPQLRAISKYGVGLDNLDIASIKEKGVEFAVTAGTNKRSVAELTLSFMLGLCHRTFIGAERIKRGEWIREGGHDLSGKTIGIIGCGNVGKEVVQLLKSFGCVILVCDIEDRSEFCRDQGVAESSFEPLIEKSDIVTLHVPLTDLTRDMIDKDNLRKMKANAYLINTSRGPVVNPSALHGALVSREISGAALDVFCSEPPDDMTFLQLPNLMVTPHIGGNSVEAVEAMGQAAIDNLAELFKKYIMIEKKNGYSQEDWQRHYDEGDLGWDLGQVAPPFVRLFESKSILPGKTLIPGCGRGHEVIYLAENGFEVTAVDYSSGAVDHLKSTVQKRKLTCEVLHMDFFDINSAHNGVYDLLIEQTFFCAILPEQRHSYVSTVVRALKQGGILAGLFFHTGEEGGPPFNTTREDILKYFSDSFEIRQLSKTEDSAEQRKDKEWLVILVKK